MRVVLDSGALSALCGRSRRATELVRWLLQRGFRVVIPTPILVECTTGSARDAEVNRIVAILRSDPAVLVSPDETLARRAGALRFAARTDDGIDALVAAVAIAGGLPTVLLTSDPSDLQRLVSGHRHVIVRRV